MFPRTRPRGLGVLGAVGCLLGLAGAAEGGQVRFPGEGHVFHPVWSADGKFLAYEVNRLAGQVDLFVSKVNGAIAADGTKISLPGQNEFTSSDVVAANPSWHPDGIVVFEGSNPGGQYRLYYHTPGGGAAAEMITTEESSGHLTFPNVAADGARLAFVAKATGNGDLYLRDTHTGSLTQVTATPSTEAFPLFSPDGSSLLFTRKHADTEDVFAVRIADGVERMVTGGPADQSRPAYARGGKRILYFDGAPGAGQWNLMSVDEAGGDAKRIGQGVELPHRARPAVSPDGEWVAWAYDDPQKGDRIMVSKVDGSKSITIPTTHTAVGEPALGKQAGRVLLAYTGLPSSGAEWRFLTVVDITDKLL